MLSERNPRGDGPPDLDELWQDFNRRINNLFNGKGGGKGGGAGGGKPGFGINGPGMKGAGIGAGVIVGIVVLLWLGSGFFIVQEGQVGVILQFGKYLTTTKAGFQWRLPYPIQSHEVVNASQVRTIEVGYRQSVKTKVPRESLMLTDDENIIDIQFAVQYRIKDAGEFLFNNRNAEDNVMQAAETAVREVVGRNKMDYVLYEGREQVAFQVNTLMQQILDRYKVGVNITSVTIQSAQPPEQVQAAFDDAVKAGQDRERQKNEGQAYANDVIPKARGTASRLFEEAEGYRQRVIAQAEGDSSRFKLVLAEYSKAPAVTRQRLYLDTMQQIFSNTTKVLVDSKSNSNLLYLPLDKLMQQAGAQDAAKAAAAASAANGPATQNSATTPAGAAAPVSSAPPAPAASNSDGDIRSRDILRNRDRESR